MNKLRHLSLTLPLVLAAGACGLNGTDSKTDESGATQASTSPAAASANAYAADPMSSHDPVGNAPLDPAAADDKPRPMMQAQVVLDRLGFAPGVVDGKDGMSTRNAITGFQKANHMAVTGKLDDATRQALSQWSNITATRVVTIPAEFAAGPFLPIPEEAADKAKLPALGYTSLDEKLAERFHTTVAVLKELNPNGVPAGMASETGASPTPPPPSATPVPLAASSDSPAPTTSFFRAGQQIRVPNVGGDTIDPTQVDDKSWLGTLAMLGVGTQQPKADKIVVDKSAGTLQAFDSQGKLIAQFTATMGSSHDPLPLGDWKILGVSKNPPFHYNPNLFWDAKSTDKKELLPPGPNGPVGVVWIDLSKEHYGIHGTPNPETIGRAESHGCVRLTNWDAARLAQMVSGSTKVSFVA
ncbi:L,D-transpeptidase family protein [Novosphingobium tardum]|uniref:L,D-transpeptidase family protein n=1 Tax=Novosphingobium tardum TaxID=1538021 RepID=A0ABV8RPM2_9SPHN